MKNYYKLLGISKNATFSEIKKAYRVKAKIFHPDLNKNRNSQAEFINIQEAYQVLKSIPARSRYDFLYDKYILHNEPKNNDRFKRKEKKRSSYVKKKASRQTKEKKGFWFFDIFIEGIFEVIFNLISEFF